MGAARLLARSGSVDEAVELAQEAMAIMTTTEELLSLPGFYLSQAEVLQLAGRDAEAAVALREAIDVAARKGAVADARVARERLEQYRP